MSRGIRTKRGARREDPKPSRRQETLKVTSERAREANRRAQQYFLSMIEGPVDPQVFVAKVRYINPQVYSDVVVERAVAGLCGYPMCCNTFTDTYGSRTYVIRSNNLYDISERRNFCSNVCYEASELVRKQVLTLPLYLRNTEDADMKDIHLPNLTKLKGCHGKLVDITGGISKLEIDDNKKPSQSTSFMTVDDIARESLVSWSENEADMNRDHTEVGEKMNRSNDADQSRTVAEESGTDIAEEGRKPVTSASVNPKHEVGHQKEDAGMLDVTGTQEEEKVKKKGGRDTNIHKENMCDKDGHKSDCDVDEMETHKCETHGDTKSKAVANPLADVLKVESMMRQWVSFDSLRLVLGDLYVRGMLEHLGCSWDNYDTTSGLRLSVEAKARYIAICRRLEHEERLEEDQQDTHDQYPGKHNQPSKPLPDYSRLQREAKKQQLKVVSFLGGCDQYEEPGEKLDTIPEGEEATRPSTKRKPKSKKQSENLDIGEPTLPFVDSYSQVAWRQNIVTEKVSSYLQQVLEMTKLNVHEVRKLLGPLVATFHLSSDNISFRPKQWRLIILILLKMLSVRCPAIQDALRTEEGLSMQRTILSAYSLDLGYSDRVLSYLTEIQHVLSKDFKDKKTEAAESKNALQNANVPLQAYPEGSLEVDRVKESVNGKDTLSCSQSLD